MFDRFIRLARARKAWRDQRYEDALQLALDPLIRADRRAEELRNAAVRELLARARARLAGGDVAAARVVAERLQRATGDAGAVALLTEIQAAQAAGEEALQAARTALTAARAALERGEAGRAEQLLADASALPAVDRKQLERRLVDQRQQAADLANRAVQQLTDGAFSPALAGFVRCQALARDHAAVETLRGRLLADGAPLLAAELRAALAAGDLPAALECRRQAFAVLPELQGMPAMRELAGLVASAVHQGLSTCGTLAEGAAFVRGRLRAEFELPAPLHAVVEALRAVPDDRDAVARGPGEAAAVLSAVAATAEAAALPKLAAAARDQMRMAAADGERLGAARACVDRGDLDGARAILTTMLAEQPLHEPARRELDLLDQGLADLERRLAEARSALRAGRLRQACTLALTLNGHSRLAAEAQQLVTQARASMALVDRGLDEVRVALHGRATATQEGLRHCLKRLEELAKLQGDHADLPMVAAAVQAEIDALAVCERTAQALERGALADSLQGLAELLAARSRLLAPARLEARICDLADRLARMADGALASGRLAEVARVAEQFEALGVVRPEFATRAAQWRQAAEQRRQAAAVLVAEARTLLAERNLADGERAVEEARRQWLECDEARALASEIRQLVEQSDALARVESMTKERDFEGAQQKLAAMPATSPFLRTRIYDMKQNLARAQGLEGAFLLRVDEGGEQLVLRGESVSIGNVRQLRADLPVLANLAGRHASIRRSMSFHGGMQDTIVAEEGDVRIGGAPVKSRTLTPGDRVQLGPALGFVYQRPTGRSLTVGLVLQSGFQVAGTDRVLLMKDRGRDGRILLGAGADVHVRVARASGEVEIFANGTGQMRVACAEGGTIDGVPFQGEHPLAAGQRIEAAGIAFELLPWRPAA